MCSLRLQCWVIFLINAPKWEAFVKHQRFPWFVDPDDARWLNSPYFPHLFLIRWTKEPIWRRSKTAWSKMQTWPAGHTSCLCAPTLLTWPPVQAQSMAMLFPPSTPREGSGYWPLRPVWTTSGCRKATFKPISFLPRIDVISVLGVVSSLETVIVKQDLGLSIVISLFFPRRPNILLEETERERHTARTCTSLVLSQPAKSW